MLKIIQFLNLILPFLYIISFSVYALDFFKEKINLGNSKRLFLLVTLFTHFSYLIFRIIEFDHPPITNKFELFTVLAFCICFAYFVLELVTDVRETGLFIIIFSVGFQLISSMFIENLYDVKEVLRNQLLGIHVISALIGHAGITLSAVYGTLFLILYRKLKTHNYGLIFNKLPNLEILEKLSFNSIVIGYCLFTVAILIGYLWLPSAFPDFNYFDPKIISASIIWTVYTIGIIAKVFLKWYGRKVIIITVIGFSFTLISMAASLIIANTFHSFT